MNRRSSPSGRRLPSHRTTSCSPSRMTNSQSIRWPKWRSSSTCLSSAEVATLDSLTTCSRTTAFGNGASSRGAARYLIPCHSRNRDRSATTSGNESDASPPNRSSMRPGRFRSRVRSSRPSSVSSCTKSLRPMRLSLHRSKMAHQRWALAAELELCCRLSMQFL